MQKRFENKPKQLLLLYIVEQNLKVTKAVTEAAV
jgi:hypothetical protein